MLGLSKTSLSFCSLFGLLALTALGHDIYIWQKDGNVFSFAYLGGIFKHYWPVEFDTTVDILGAESFNALLTPILALPAVHFFAGLTLFSFVVGFVAARVKPFIPSRQVAPKEEKRKTTLTQKDKVKYRIK